MMHLSKQLLHDTNKNIIIIDFGDPLDNPQLLGIINAIMSVGSFVGVFFAPYLSDNLGRKKAIFIGSLINLVGVALQTAAVNGRLQCIYDMLSCSHKKEII